VFPDNIIIKCKKIFLLFSVLVLFCAGFGNTNLKNSYRLNPNQSYKLTDSIFRGTSFVFVGDTQIPMWIETIFLRKDNNEEATKKIFGSICEDNNVQSVFHLGDVVAMSSDDDDWEMMDLQLSKLQQKNIPIFLTPGNHEYMLNSEKGKDNFVKRFPDLAKKTWQLKIINKVAVLLLNSNFSQLSESEVKEQQSWYENQLIDLQKDSTVKMIIVACHHSPYTNSKIVGPSDDVKSNFVRQFIKSDKCKLFLSGHCHAIEHFKQEGKDFIVSGGGGGILQTLHIGADTLYKDYSPKKSNRSFFHYLYLQEKDEGLDITVKMLKQDYSSFYDAYEITIPW